MARPDAATDDEEEPMVLELTRLMFVVVWWAMFLTHASIAALLFATNLLYAYMGSFRLMYYNKLLASNLRGELANLGWLFSVVGAVHCVEMAKMVLVSAHARELSFRFQPRRSKVAPSLPPAVVAVQPLSSDNDMGVNSSSVAAAPPLSSQATARTTRVQSLRHLLHTAVRLTFAAYHTVVRWIPRRVRVAFKRGFRALLRVRRALYDRHHGYMSVQSEYFNYVFLVRETVEIASQSYQMHNSAELLARPWLNALFLSLVVANCWSTPLLQHALAHSTGLERVVCLVLDGLLDAGSALVIPLVVFLPYAQAFDTVAFTFLSDQLYDPQWFVNMVRENRMLFAMSMSDLVSKLVPHHSLYSCMKNIKKFIVCKPLSLPGGVQGVGGSPDGKQPKAKAKVEVVYPSKGKRLVHVVFTLWGIAVLVIYLHARHVSVSADVSACKLKLRPWFATTYACASYTFDCDAQGHVDSIAARDLAGLHSDYLATLVIANCPALVMPAELQRFPNLLKFLLYNSSIASWDTTASLNAHYHVALISISLVRVNMTAFPLGLQATLPNTMQDFQVSTSNVTTLPASLSKVWSPLTLYYFEYCAFAKFPAVLLELRCDDLSLAGSQIATLPSNMTSLVFPWVHFVLSNSSQLSEFPTTGIRASALSIENTGVTELPAWVTVGTYSGMTGLAVYAYNTPYCIRKLTGVSDSSTGSSSGADSSSSSSASTPTSSGGALPGGGGTGVVTINCEARDPDGDARYPLALTTAMFQPA